MKFAGFINFQYFNENVFDATSLNNWNVSTPSIQILQNNCTIVGGLDFNDGAFLSMKFNFENFPHFMIYLQFTLFKFGIFHEEFINMAGYQSFYFYSGKYSLLPNSTGSNDLEMHFNHRIYNQEKIYNFFIESNINTSMAPQNARGWGIRDLNISLLLCHPTCRSCTSNEPDHCTSCLDFGHMVGGYCSCADGFFLAVNLTFRDFPISKCDFCHQSCKTCLIYGEFNCLSCFEGYSFYGGRCLFAGIGINFLLF